MGERAKIGEGDIWTIPNLLTILRILLTPGFVMAYVTQRLDLAWVLFAVAGFTDALDGFLAKMLKQRTKLGAMLDPLADKILLVTSFICVSLQGWLPKWLAVLVVSRDAIIVGGLAVLHFWGVNIRERIRPSWVSKITTTVQIALILLVIFQKTADMELPRAQLALVWLVGGFTVVSGIHYVLVGMGLLSEEEREGRVE